MTKERVQFILDNVGEYVGSPSDSSEVIIELACALKDLMEKTNEQVS